MEANAVAGIANADSITAFLEQLKKTFSDVKQLNKDLTLSDDERFSMFISIVDNAPNNR